MNQARKRCEDTMGATRRSKTPPVFLVYGDPYLVRTRAQELLDLWKKEIGECEVEVIECESKSSTAISGYVSRIMSSLQTYGLFVRAKVVWVRNFEVLLGGDRGTRGGDSNSIEGAEGIAGHKNVHAKELEALAKALHGTEWDNPVPIRLLLTAESVDRRRAIVKVLEQIGCVEEIPLLSPNLPDWETIATEFIRRAFALRDKQISEAAIIELITRVGPNAAALDNEAEKLSLYVGEAPEVTVDDVRTVCPTGHYAKAFALADALGERNLPEVLKHLKEELYEMERESGYSELGLLYGLVSKIRQMLLAQGLLERGYVNPRMSYLQFKAQLKHIPVDIWPEDERINPLKMHSFVLYRAMIHAQNYTKEELIQALTLLLDCSFRLVSSTVDVAAVLQETIIKIIGIEKRNTIPARGIKN